MPDGDCVYIMQSMSACVITNMLHFQHSKIHPNLKAIAQLAYIVTDTDCDYGSLFNIFIMFPTFPMYPILVYLIVGLYSHSYGVCIKVFWLLMAKNFIK